MKYDTVHSRTPALTVIDARGLPIRQIAYLHSVAADPPSALVSCQHHDVAGRLAAQYDPRLPVANATNVYALDGTVLYTDSADSGLRLVLPGLAGEPLHRWDKRDHHWQSTFDMLLRVKTLKEASGDQIDSFSYGESSADGDCNLRGQLIEQTDFSGSLKITGYALTGQAIAETRTFRDGEPFTSHQVFSPLGAVQEQTDAGGHRRALRYGLAGQLRQVDLEIKGHSVKRVMLDAQYNANNQIIAQLAGNGVLSQWTYDPADGRLHTQTSHKPGEDRLQDLEYFYDRVGNVIRIEDHAFEPTWSANQRVDGHREFSYDSLYRLIHATGHDDALPPDIPGLPQPPTEKNRLNYTQTYSYDDGGNLIELRHQRDGASRTRRMYIDDQSNRGVRRETGDDEPDFSNWFDLHGNQRRLRHGPTLHWNKRDELEHIDLVVRPDSANDAEYYRYSQGVRVFKRHETFAPGANHFHQVRYLPGLEIRSKDNGEELHVISLGSARCLHWVTNPPAENNQVRYTLDDHLGSCVMELNEEATVTSEEGYYPFGETAWMAPESEIEYRFIRYSGKEMDVSGLYYYGARYYAPWLQRWISADPAGDVDGLNLYVFVRNNPMTYVDPTGSVSEIAQPESGGVLAFITGNTPREQILNQIASHSELLAAVDLAVRDVTTQILNHRSEKYSRVSTAKRTGFFLAGKGISNGVGIALSAAGTAMGIPGGPLGMLIGVALGLLVGKAVSKTTKKIGEETGLNTSLDLQPDRLKAPKLVKQIQVDRDLLATAKGIADYNPSTSEGRKKIKQGAIDFGKDTALAVAGKIPGVGPAIKAIPDTIDLLKEVNRIGADLTEDEVTALDADITGTINMLQRRSERLIERVKTTSLSGRVRRIERIDRKTAKRINLLRDLRTVLHSNSSTFTAV